MNLDFLKHIFYSFGIHIAFATLCFVFAFYGFKFNSKSFDTKPIAISTISVKDYELMNIAKISSTTQVVKAAPTKQKKVDTRKPTKNVNVNQNTIKTTPAPTPTLPVPNQNNSPSLGILEEKTLNSLPQSSPPQQTTKAPENEVETTSSEKQSVAPDPNSHVPDHTQKDLTAEDVFNLQSSGKQSEESSNPQQGTSTKEVSKQENENTPEKTDNAHHDDKKSDITNLDSQDTDTSTKHSSTQDPEIVPKAEDLQAIFSHQSDLMIGEKNTVSVQHFITLKFMKCWEKYQSNLRLLDNTEVDIEVQFAQDGTIMSLDEKEPYIQTDEESPSL